MSKLEARLQRLEAIYEDLKRRQDILEFGPPRPLIVPVAALEDPKTLAAAQEEWVTIAPSPVMIILPEVTYDL